MTICEQDGGPDNDLLGQSSFDPASYGFVPGLQSYATLTHVISSPDAQYELKYFVTTDQTGVQFQTCP